MLPSHSFIVTENRTRAKEITYTIGVQRHQKKTHYDVGREKYIVNIVRFFSFYLRALFFFALLRVIIVDTEDNFYQ